jgi:hypothetical protein
MSVCGRRQTVLVVYDTGRIIDSNVGGRNIKDCFATTFNHVVGPAGGYGKGRRETVINW